MRRLLLVAAMRFAALRDRLRLRFLCWLHPGLEVDPAASSNFAVARLVIAPGGRVRIGPGAVTERLPGRLHIQVAPGAEVWIGPDVWLRTELGPVNVIAFEGARIRLERAAFLNGCHISAKRSIELGERAQVGPGSRVFDSEQHDFDDARPERGAPVSIGAHAWVAADATVLQGVRIGAHSIVGARSLVTRDVPDHRLAFGIPAEVRGEVGDRSQCR